MRRGPAAVGAGLVRERSASSRGSPVTTMRSRRTPNALAIRGATSSDDDRKERDAASGEAVAHGRRAARTSRWSGRNDTRSAAGESRCSFFSGMPCQSCTTNPPRVRVPVHVAEPVGHDEDPRAQRQTEPAPSRLAFGVEAESTGDGQLGIGRRQPDQPHVRSEPFTRRSVQQQAHPRRRRSPTRMPRVGGCAESRASRAPRARRAEGAAPCGRCRLRK